MHFTVIILLQTQAIQVSILWVTTVSMDTEHISLITAKLAATHYTFHYYVDTAVYRSVLSGDPLNVGIS